MNQEVNKFKEIAYTLYPQGLLDRTLEYEETTENQRLKKALKNKENLSNILEEISYEVISTNSFLKFENLSNALLADRCVKGQFYQDINRKGSLFVLISLIQPYYLVYESSDTYFPKTIGDLNISSNFIKDVNYNSSLLKNIKNIICGKLPSYNEFPSEYLNVEIDEVTYDGIGSLKVFNQSKNIFKMTLFNVFFSNNYL